MPFSAYFYNVTDGASGDSCIPLVTPSTLLLSSRGRVKLCQNNGAFGCGPPAHLAGYLAPEYRHHRHFSDTDVEKVHKHNLRKLCLVKLILFQNSINLS